MCLELRVLIRTKVLILLSFIIAPQEAVSPDKAHYSQFRRASKHI